MLAIFGFFFDVCLILGGVLATKGSDHFPLLATSAMINGGTFMTLIAVALGTLVEIAWRFERHSGAIDAKGVAPGIVHDLNDARANGGRKRPLINLPREPRHPTPANVYFGSCGSQGLGHRAACNRRHRISAILADEA